MDFTNEKEAISALIGAYNNAINNAQVSGIVGLYADNGILMPQGAPLSQGRTQLEKTYQALLGAFSLDVNYVIDEISVLGSHGIVRTHSSGTNMLRSGGESQPVNNKEIFLVVKEKGEWKISHYMFNNNSRS